jgi:hypothetical protein
MSFPSKGKDAFFRNDIVVSETYATTILFDLILKMMILFLAVNFFARVHGMGDRALTFLYK